MRKQSNIVYTSLSRKDMAILIKEVNETIATGFTGQHHKIFTTADLWNIQRQGKPGIQRRYL